MNVTVYLASSRGKRSIFEEKVRELGKWIGENGHTLIYGGSKIGLMGVIADSTLEAGGEVIGVEPKAFVENYVQHEGITQLIVTDDLPDRRQKLIEMGDIFVAMPGGLGTLDEISEVFCLMTVDMFDKPCIIVNIDGYYDSLITFIDKMVEEGFLAEKVRDNIHFVNDVADIAIITQN